MVTHRHTSPSNGRLRSGWGGGLQVLAGFRHRPAEAGRRARGLGTRPAGSPGAGTRETRAGPAVARAATAGPMTRGRPGAAAARGMGSADGDLERPVGVARDAGEVVDLAQAADL